MNHQKIITDDLSENELKWIEAARRRARDLVKIYLQESCANRPTVGQIHRTYDCWLAEFNQKMKRRFFKKKSPPTIDPNNLVISLGIALGDRFVSQTNLEWKIITDSFGTDMGLFDPGTPGKLTDIVMYPMNMVAKRVEARTADWIHPVYDKTIHSLNIKNDKSP